jgi:hypothetical protein
MTSCCKSNDTNKLHYNLRLHIVCFIIIRIRTWQILFFYIQVKDEELDLPPLYCIPRLYKCPTNYSRGGVNQMWILKNSKYMLEYIQSRSLSSCNSINTFVFSTLYTIIPPSKLNDRLRELIQLYFIKKEWPT